MTAIQRRTYAEIEYPFIIVQGGKTRNPGRHEAAMALRIPTITIGSV